MSQATRLPDARVEESPALVDSSDCTSNCTGFSPQVNPTHPSLRRLGAGSSGFTPCLSAPKRASSCKLVPFFGNLIALLPSELVLLDEVAIHSVSSLSEKPRARSLSPVGSRAASTVKATDAAPQPKTKPKPYKIPKMKAVAPAPASPVVQGFSSGEDSDSNTDGFSAADVLSDDSSDSNYEPVQKKKRKRSASFSDESLCDGDFNMFDPLAVKKNKLSSVQSSYVRKMFSKLIKAEDLEESFETLGIEKSSDPCLQVKELDPELLDVIPGSHFVNKSVKSLTAIESRVLRAATPALSLWSELQAARNDQKTAVDVNKLITLAEASVCALGQASVEVKFQRRMAVASRILKDKKKAKNVIHQNADVLENEKKYLFGSSLTKQLVKRISRSNKLKETRLTVQNRKAFRKSGRGKSRQFQPSKPYHRPTASTTSTEAPNQPFPQGPRGTSTNRGGKGRGKKPYSRYVPICLSEQKSTCISSKRKFWFKGRHCSKTVKRHCLMYTIGGGGGGGGGGDPDSGSLDFGCSSRESHQLGKCPSTRQDPTTTKTPTN